jgi:hypothetical protein
LIIQKGGFLQIILPLIPAAVDLFSTLFKKMKQAVVPYDEKKEIKIYKTPDTKISDIINNNSLSKNDKVNLINKLLIKKQNNWPTNDEISVNTSDRSFDESFVDNFDDDPQISFKEPIDTNLSTGKLTIKKYKFKKIKSNKYIDK